MRKKAEVAAAARAARPDGQTRPAPSTRPARPARPAPSIAKTLAGVVGFYVVVEVLSLTGLLNPYWQLILDQALMVTIASIGLSLIYGFCGQFSLGQAAFYGLGAYTAGLIGKLWGHGNPVWFVGSLVAGTVVAGAVAYLVGMPILRLRSDYLGIATMGFGIIVKVLMDNSAKLTPAAGGPMGMSGMPLIANFTWIYIVTIGVVILARNLIYSTYGRSFVAVREDELAADAVGVNTTAAKTMAFVAGSALAGLAGGLYAHRYPLMHPSSFDFLKSFDFLLVVVLGGLGSLSGTIVTSVAWVFLLELLRMVLGSTFLDFRGVIYALLLIVVIIMKPQGLLGGLELRALVPMIPGLGGSAGRDGEGSGVAEGGRD